MEQTSLLISPKDYDNVRKRYNGQVDIISQHDPNAVFKMQERIAIRNKSTNYDSALSGNDLEKNLLSKTFFSSANIQIIQNGLRAGVYNMSGDKQIVIPPQNIDHLKIIMRSTYLQHAKHLPDKIRQQIELLNTYVLNYAVPTVYNEAVGYLKYLEDKSTLVVPMEHPQHTDRTYKQLELKPWFGMQLKKPLPDERINNIH
uniref:Minor capsid protein P8 central region domain-containing protein n=1 Tax=viral metagenome TaxID=1070528 RepID=A0A6C0HYV8_9ZZZZ